jgi:hypothetical protein
VRRDETFLVLRGGQWVEVRLSALDVLAEVDIAQQAPAVQRRLVARLVADGWQRDSGAAVWRRMAA